MHRRIVVALVVVAVVAAACSSSDDSDDTSADTEAPVSTEAPDGATDTTDASADTEAPAAMDPGSQVGITDTELNLAMVYADLAPIIESGLIPDFGDYRQDLDFFIEKANREGKFGGRTASITYHDFPAGAVPGDQLPACLAATEDNDTFVVLTPGGIAEETILCVTEQHETLMMSVADANTQTLYERSGGRFFNNAMAVNRLIEVAIAAYTEQGLLDGKTIGIVRPDDTADTEVAEKLTAELEAHGYEVAQDLALACENNSCANIEPGVEALRAAGVDAVFSLLGALPYPEFVLTAGAAGFVPQYFSSDYENQVFDTTARFMQRAAEYYDGAIGTSSAVQQSQVDEFRQQCNDDFTAETGVEYEPLTDGWRLVGNLCDLVDRVDRVISNIEADGLEVGQDTFIKYMEEETVRNGDRTGTFGPDKHDAYDVYAQLRYDMNCRPDDPDGITGCWKEVEGTRDTWEG